jgi:hypothetical protein
MKTAEQIVEISESKSQTALGQRRIINRLYRRQDDSNKWPINGKFDVTERAIRKANKFERAGGALSNYEYCLFLENEQSNIVNNERNW